MAAPQKLILIKNILIIIRIWEIRVVMMENYLEALVNFI